MGRIVIFGAGGRAGRQAVAEARRRGHEVTAVVRDPAGHGGLTDDGVRVAAGDVTDVTDVATLAAGHDAAINAAAVYGAGTDPDAFFPAAARALVKGLPQAGVDRLVAVGLSVLLPGPDGTRLLDAPGFPAEARPFCLAHAAGLEVLRAEGGTLDWVYVSPAGDFDHEGGRTGGYDIREHGDAAARISYADFALALLDEAETPRHHRGHLAVG
ncbi:NAD(P)-dependent oxidoreductase [Actinoallomurus rhizosphaericola]|uniref:NAD(P)-dependent oxidoreductase n=1 Tax=Actinoallomurus rhizosphaericola TaxID=2952536 RepID=UPI002092E7F5|nr:NAD(P)H-binding protein [Actinoallomurus rhizosphaericola]MCO5998879.1 NAD(P)H-binding protein [Actinoallomurus rhizosphaericola]